MSWIVLLIAGLLEVVWAIGLKYTHGFTRLTPSIITIAAMIVSIAMLSWAMRTLPVGTTAAWRLQIVVWQNMSFQSNHPE